MEQYKKINFDPIADDDYKSYVSASFPTCPCCGAQYDDEKIVFDDVGFAALICKVCNRKFKVRKDIVYESMIINEEAERRADKAVNNFFKVKKTIEFMEKKDDN